MKTVMVRYKVKADRAEENTQFIQAIFRKLSESAPEGLNYTSLQHEDGVSFTHIATIDTRDGSNPLLALEEFKAFTQDIGERCDEPPAAVDVSIVGRYRSLE